MTTYSSLDLFSGCGGLSLGMSLARNEAGDSIETKCAIDNWEIACKTFELNLGLSPICDSVEDELIEKVNSEFGPFDIVVGGPPCQGFSTAGKRALGDKRNGLVLAFLRAIEITNPKVFVMENVAGFRSFQEGKIYEEVVEYARKLGYHVRSAVVLASLSGVPQRRKRFLLVGSKSSNFIFPGESGVSEGGSLFSADEHGNEFFEDFHTQTPSTGTETWTFDDATSDLPVLVPGQRIEEYLTEPQNELQRYFRFNSKIPQDHVAVGHREYFIEMMSYIPQGRSGLDPDIQKLMPESIRPKSGFKNSYQRIIGTQPSPTITRNFTTPSSANCIHPYQNRALSLREGARCQSFPDWFKFLGTIDEKRLQIGNAVPPLLGKAIGEAILNALNC